MIDTNKHTNKIFFFAIDKSFFCQVNVFPSDYSGSYSETIFYGGAISCKLALCLFSNLFQHKILKLRKLTFCYFTIGTAIFQLINQIVLCDI